MDRDRTQRYAERIGGNPGRNYDRAIECRGRFAGRTCGLHPSRTGISPLDHVSRVERTPKNAWCRADLVADRCRRTSTDSSATLAIKVLAGHFSDLIMSLCANSR